MNNSQPPTFETLIANLSFETQWRLRGEFESLSENGRKSFDTLFQLAYERGKIEAAEELQGIAKLCLGEFLK